MPVGIHKQIPDWKGNFSTCLLVAAWLYANISSLEWLFQAFVQASRFSLILIGFIVAVLVVQVIRVRSRDGLANRPFLISTTAVVRLYPVLVMLGAGAGAIALRWLVDMPQLSMLLFALGTYGLLGLFLAPSIWHKNLPAAALIACILPFSSQFGTGVGLPARILTANTVEKLLSTLHVAAISSRDIIVLENGIARIDIPCSGIKTLWTGTLFLLAVTWLERRILNAKWLLVCVSSLFLLVSANTVRVLLLVVITYVLKQPQVAEIMHIPLGIIGFIGACALTWAMLQTVPKHEEKSSFVETRVIASLQDPSVVELNEIGITKPNSKNKLDFATAKLDLSANLLLGVVVAIALFSQIQPPQAQPLAIASLKWPQQMRSELIPLTAIEQRAFENPGTLSEKRRFVSGDLSGSMLLVSSTSWDRYHPPELCLLGSGLKIDRVEKKQLTPDVIARWISLQNGELSATYWLQSSGQTTDDFLSRLWSQINRKSQTWVMVSILFNHSRNPESPQIQKFADSIYDVIARSFN